MLSLSPAADLAVMYAADAARYEGGCVRGSGVTDVVSLEAFVSFYEGCPSIGFQHDGEAIGGILFDGEEAHIAVLPQWHGRWAFLLKPALQWLYSLRSEVFVAVECDNTRCLRFMDRHGWQRVRSDDSEIVYRLVPQGGIRKTDYPFFSPGSAVRSPHPRPLPEGEKKHTSAASDSRCALLLWMQTARRAA